ncbi:hypothetical protein [Arthrobacter sp. NIO-1057]|uniref:hypothetical protein n=1 Tax=Arthrobacter sp. NIO-1057 TaxID=993071 RepID=UPI00081775DC|nr:hypothetical protein [Arthrobacter sp. NIO-1057]SCB81194.1 hypothetical protein GA0061084_0369 [Arthrobacter sp. NIO-1057]
MMISVPCCKKEGGAVATVEEAFRDSRCDAEQHMVACEQAGLRWNETSITEIVVSRAARGVTVVPFTQRAEALSGADWVWWWVDAMGAYGMLVQAKRVTVTGTEWSFGFDYQSKHATRRQRENLRSAAKSLDLLPVYALYLGSGVYRGWEPCCENHMNEGCYECIKRSVSLMPELLAEQLIVNDAVSTYERSVAIEDLWDSPQSESMLIPALRPQLAPELAEFLNEEQDGTRAVARQMIDRVLRARAGVFGAAPTIAVNPPRSGEHDRLGPVFNDFPADTGHWGINYFDYTLAPLRHAPPSYVIDVMSGAIDVEHLASEMPENVAGIVVVHLPQQRVNEK